MSGHLIELEKRPGVHPVGVGETWRRLSSKFVLRVTGPEATNVCQYEQLCAGLNVVIERDVNGVQAIWDAKFSKK